MDKEFVIILALYIYKLLFEFIILFLRIEFTVFMCSLVVITD